MIKILLILFELGFIVNYNIVGQISLSELFLLITSFYYFSRTNFKDKNIATLTKLYLLLLAAQILSELLVENELANALKGMAVTIVSYLHFIFLYFYLKKDHSLLLYCLIGVALRLFIQGDLSGGDGFGDVGDSRFVYVIKFYVAPILITLISIVSLIKTKWNIEAIAIFLGLLCIVLGARSSGLIMFLTGVISILIKSKSKLKIKSFTPMIIMAVVVFMSAYYYYVSQVINGKITSGNSEQLLRVENPYNPLNLLMTGRTEVFVGAVAFVDKPLTGWGAWADDPNWKYHQLQNIIGSREKDFTPSSFDNPAIPSHSILIGYGMQNGILAFIAFLLLSIFIIKRAIYSIKRIDIHNIILISFLINFCWIILFSPLSHFRLTLPLYMVYIVLRYRNHKYNDLVKCSNSSL